MDYIYRPTIVIRIGRQTDIWEFMFTKCLTKEFGANLKHDIILCYEAAQMHMWGP